jgi:branched-chain amino acid aminotransferase
LTGGGWNLNVDGGKGSLAIAAWEWGNYLGEEALAKGIRANISSFTRHHVNVMMTKAKVSGNYANSFLAKTESERLGFQEAILLDPQGYVAECTGENIFIVRHGKIYTPATAPVLEGITRHSVHSIARDLGYKIRERPISRDQLYSADEVFVCGTAAECIGLSEIDFRKIGDGRTGPITRSIQKFSTRISVARIRATKTGVITWSKTLTMKDGLRTTANGPAFMASHPDKFHPVTNFILDSSTSLA